MAIKMIDDSKLQNIAVAIQGKDGGGKMTVDEMPGRIDNINGGGSVPNPNDPLLLIDWDGTLLYSYTYEDAQLISEFPDPPTHEGLTFQEWNSSEVIAKTWLQRHRNGQLRVGAIYTATDGQDHNYWRSPRLTEPNQIYMQKRGTASVDNNTFKGYYLLSAVNIPKGTPYIRNYAFENCYALKHVNIPNGTTSFAYHTFAGCSALASISIPDSIVAFGVSAFAQCRSLASIRIPHGTSKIPQSSFDGCYNLSSMDLPNTILGIESYAFGSCLSLCDIVIRSKPTLTDINAFTNGSATQRFYVHRTDLEWFETATNWSAIYGEGKIVAAADYIDYLQSIGIDTTDFEGE